MPHGQRDFWPGSVVAMPAVGAGQVPWFMSEAHLVNFGETYDLINYVVPDTFELHVCSGVVSCGTPRAQRYDLRQTPAATWIRPTGHSDPDRKWYYEERAYDGNVDTYAHSDVLAAAWSSYLTLTTNPNMIDKVRFYAFYHPTSINKADIDVWYEEAWHNFPVGVFANQEWVEVNLGAAHLVTKARIRFYNADVEYFQRCALCELQFNTTGVTYQEGIWFDTHAIIPYTAEAPYIVEPKAKFVVKVYNDDDRDSNMAVALAGFLQPAII